MMVTISRIFKAGARNFLRNAWLSTAATVVMTVTLTIILSSFIANNALNATVRGIVKKIDVSVYLNDNATTKQVDELRSKLARVENVAEVKYVSKREALERYKENFKDDPKILEGISNYSDEENPLPASLEIKAKDPKNLDPISQVLEEKDVKPLVKESSYSGERKVTIDKIIRASNFIKTTGLISSFIFIIISVLIIFNTIRMAIFTRREEIEIMKLVGATKWFIRGPFMCEAAMYGIIAAIVAMLIVYSMLIAGGPALVRYDVDVNAMINLFKQSPVLILLAELMIGVLIGVGSSVMAMIRYLKL